jgi:hypothetical protein
MVQSHIQALGVLRWMIRVASESGWGRGAAGPAHGQ